MSKKEDKILKAEKKEMDVLKKLVKSDKNVHKKVGNGAKKKK